MKRTKLTAAGLRLILIACLIAMIAGGTAGFIFIRGLLVKKAEDTATVMAKVTASDSQLQTLKDADKTLTSNADIAQKVSEMVPAQSDYEYQDAIALNIIALAKKAGISIKNIDYSAGTATTSTGTTSGTSSSSTVSLPGGITSTTANITFDTPLRYDQWLAFVHYIEVNTLRMEIGSISISSTGTSQAGHSLISSGGFTIGVYIRNA